MAGFLDGLFGGKKKGPEQPKEAFFLDDDSAKSLGDIEYMRKPSTVRRTFPKSVSSPDKKEYVQETSAMDKAYVKSQGTILNAGGVKPRMGGGSSIQPKKAEASNTPSFTPAASAFNPEPQAPTPTFQAQPSNQAANKVKRSPDNSMDMFKKMAKDINR